jgi:hypothetical protein
MLRRPVARPVSGTSIAGSSLGTPWSASLLSSPNIQLARLQLDVGARPPAVLGVAEPEHAQRPDAERHDRVERALVLVLVQPLRASPS